jgi:hypothetical protein
MNIVKFEVNNQGRYSYIETEDLGNEADTLADALSTLVLRSGFFFSTQAVEDALEEAREATQAYDSDTMFGWLRGKYGSILIAYLAHSPSLTVTRIA